MNASADRWKAKVGELRAHGEPTEKRERIEAAGQIMLRSIAGLVAG